MNNEAVKVTSHPKLFWQEVANQIGGEFKLTKQNQNFGELVYDYYHLRIVKMYKGVEIIIHSTYSQSQGKFEEYYLSSLRVTSNIEKRDEFHLYLWRKGFFERFFSLKNSRTGFPTFDKTIAFETNRKKDVQILFSDSEIREILINDYSSIFNIQHESGVLKIKLQTGKIIWDKEILIEEYNKFLKFMDGLLKVGLITTACNKSNYCTSP